MPTIAHFDIPADEPARAKDFYEKLFGWKMTQIPGPNEYYLFQTTSEEGEVLVRGGLGKRGDPAQRITNFIGVRSLEEYSHKVKELGGRIVQEKTTVPGWGYLMICTDTEDNTFGLWEEDINAE